MFTAKNLILGAGMVSTLAFANQSKVQNFLGQRDKKSNKTQVFIWGNGDYQARPDVGVQFKNFEPKRIDQFNNKNSEQYNFQKVYFGEFHEAAIDEKGGLFVWKKQKLPSFSDPNSKDNQREGLIKLQNQNIVQVAFTKGFVWGLDNKGQVYSWQIKRDIDEYKEVVDTQINEQARLIKTLPKNISNIQAGEDHFVALTTNGEVFTMGDDTYGQCGQGAEQRSTAPPFFDKRIRNPKKVENLPTIAKIIAGHNHTLALSENGQLFGWGSNQTQQLSHEVEYSKVNEPLIAIYTPLRLSTNLEDSIVTDMAAGEGTSFIVTKNKSTGDCEVFSCGYNINGQLGLGFLRHVNDIQKMEGLSNYKIQVEKGKEENITVKKIACGAHHCMALLSVGALMEWGQNEYGQLGNKKRSFSENPIILGKFKDHNILDISCGWNQSCVITERVDKNNEEQKQKK